MRIPSAGKQAPPERLTPLGHNKIPQYLPCSPLYFRYFFYSLTNFVTPFVTSAFLLTPLFLISHTPNLGPTLRVHAHIPSPNNTCFFNRSLVFKVQLGKLTSDIKFLFPRGIFQSFSLPLDKHLTNRILSLFFISLFDSIASSFKFISSLSVNSRRSSSCAF